LTPGKKSKLDVDVCDFKDFFLSNSPDTAGYEFYDGCGKRFATTTGYVMFSKLQNDIINPKEIQVPLKSYYSNCCSLGLRPVSFETAENIKCVHTLLSRFIVLKNIMLGT
jgi:hypothetical protein